MKRAHKKPEHSCNVFLGETGELLATFYSFVSRAEAQERAAEALEQMAASMGMMDAECYGLDDLVQPDADGHLTLRGCVCGLDGRCAWCAERAAGRASW